MTLKFERIKRYFANTKLKTKYNLHFKFQKFASVFVISLMLPVSLIPANSQSYAGNDQSAGNSGANVKLTLSESRVLAADSQISEIKPGDSATDVAAKQAAAEAAAAAQAKARKVVVVQSVVYNDPSNFDSIYAGAGAAYGVDPKILKAIHLTETGGAGSTDMTNHSGSGAQGPMQFLPSTFRSHGVDGNGDGRADINNVSDAIYTAAAYLRACGYPNLQKSLWGYNPSQSYYNKIVRLANSFGN